jgi:hypothetical protein
MSSKTTLLPEYISIVQNTSLDFYNKSTNLLTVIGKYATELDQNIKFNKSLVTTNVLSSYGVLYNELNKTDFTLPNYIIPDNQSLPTIQGTRELDNSFKLFFIEKYLSLSKQYKQRVDKFIQNNKYFKPFSDDIGIITDTTPIIDNNTSPYFDVFNQQTFYQTNLPASLLTKVSRNELVVTKTLSYYTDPMLKLNLVGLQEGDVNDNTAKTSHGTNLINDILYYQRAVKNQEAFLEELQVILGEISDFILFFKDLNPKDKDKNRFAILSKYTITNLEKMQVSVDVLKNNLKKIALSSRDVLGVD